jgi:hypothetical protein
MTIFVILIILFVLLLFIPGSYMLDDYLYGVYSADTQASASAYYADSIAPRVVTKTTYDYGAFDGILPSGTYLS